MDIQLRPALRDYDGHGGAFGRRAILVLSGLDFQPLRFSLGSFAMKPIRLGRILKIKR